MKPNKQVLLFSLFIISILFLVSCVPKDVQRTLAGQAYTVGSCTDSDANTVEAGKNYNVRGTAKLGTTIKTDTCFVAADGKNQLREYYCDVAGTIQKIEVLCSTVSSGKVCDTGACIAPSCSDGDSKNYQQRLTTKGLASTGDRFVLKTDSCATGADAGKVIEYFCASNLRDVQSELISCPSGQSCLNGACTCPLIPGSTTARYTACGPRCVDIKTSATDCGNCGVVCGAGQVCQNSLCVLLCGNGKVNTEVGENCDDGNLVNGDGCSGSCGVETGWTCTGAGVNSCISICGDSLQVGTEKCDNGILNGQICAAPYGGNCVYCDSSCQSVVVQGGFCGDSLPNTDEGETCTSCPVDVACGLDETCQQGACLKICTDSDGNDLQTKGTTTLINPDGTTVVKQDGCDSHSDGWYMNEWSCVNNALQSNLLPCPAGTDICSEGACLTIYDEFKTSSLDLTKWEETAASDSGTEFVEEHRGTNGGYITSQSTPANRAVTLITTRSFSAGETFEYFITQYGGSGNQLSRVYFDGSGEGKSINERYLDTRLRAQGYDQKGFATSGDIGYWNGASEVGNMAQGSQSNGQYHVKVEFETSGTKVTMTNPLGVSYPFQINLPLPARVGFSTKTGHDGTTGYTYYAVWAKEK